MSEQEMRLSKRMVELGLCSRREADAFIEQGRVGWMVRWYNNWAAGRGQPAHRTGQPRMVLGELSISLLLHRAADSQLPLASLITPRSALPVTAARSTSIRAI
jgi:23S rRNA pseudouridine2604 synthase